MPARSFIAALAAVTLVAACARNDAPDDAVSPATGSHMPRLVEADEIVTAPNIPTIDPHTLADAHIEKVIGAGPRCVFRYTSSGKPVLAIARQPSPEGAAGVVMLNGDLLALQSSPSESGIALAAGEIRFTLTPGDGQSTTPLPSNLEDADLVFEVADQMRVGYGGYYGCDGSEDGG